jgi:hypothetical protein
MTLQLLHSKFLIYEENLIFFFISVENSCCYGILGFQSPSVSVLGLLLLSLVLLPLLT